MTSKLLLAIGVFAAVAATTARADDADASQYVIQFQGSRARAEVQAEAAAAVATRSNEPAGSRVAAPVRSSVDVKQVRAQAAEAVRQGLIPRGEAG